MIVKKQIIPLDLNISFAGVIHPKLQFIFQWKVLKTPNLEVPRSYALWSHSLLVSIEGCPFSLYASDLLIKWNFAFQKKISWTPNGPIWMPLEAGCQVYFWLMAICSLWTYFCKINFHFINSPDAALLFSCIREKGTPQWTLNVHDIKKGCMTLGHSNWTIWSPWNLFLENFNFHHMHHFHFCHAPHTVHASHRGIGNSQWTLAVLKSCKVGCASTSLPCYSTYGKRPLTERRITLALSLSLWHFYLTKSLKDRQKNCTWRNISSGTDNFVNFLYLTLALTFCADVSTWRNFKGDPTDLMSHPVKDLRQK